jgi:hypothetical protein
VHQSRLDAALIEDGETPLGSLQAEQPWVTEADVEASMALTGLHKTVRGLFSDKDERIFYDSTGLDGRPEQSLDQIAAREGLGHEAVRRRLQLVKQALQHPSTPLRSLLHAAGEEWREAAACRTDNPADARVFFSRKDREQALKVCADCPVSLECAQLASRLRVLKGVWGGEWHDERNRPPQLS